jgi:hypothetical protein
MSLFLPCVGDIVPCRMRLYFMTLLVLHFITWSSWSHNSSGCSKWKRTLSDDIPQWDKNLQTDLSSAWSEIVFSGAIEKSGCTKLRVRPYWHGVEIKQPYLAYWVNLDDSWVPSGHQVGYKKALMKPQWYDSMMDMNQGVHLVESEWYASTTQEGQTGPETNRERLSIISLRKVVSLELGYDLL